VGETYRNFLNTLFGLMTKDQHKLNPMFETEGVKYSSNVFKSRRLDRINHTARLTGRPFLPFGYEQVKANLFPVGVPESSNTPMFEESNRLTNINPQGAMMTAIKRENPRFNPDSELVEIYRATVGDSIRPNDFVAMNKAIAQDHLESLKDRGEKGKLIMLKVKPRDLLMANDATEFIYAPTE
jgi:hypothetical protein